MDDQEKNKTDDSLEMKQAFLSAPITDISTYIQ